MLLRKITAVILSLLMLFSITSCALFEEQKTEIDETLFDFETQLSPPETGETIAVVTTSFGTFKMKFFPQYAPNTVENFITLAREGYYDGSYIFCIDPNNAFMSGSGDNQGIDYKSIHNEGKPFDNECTDALWHFSGSVSAISTAKGKGDSRFLMLGEVTVSGKTIASMEKYGYPASLVEQYRTNGGAPNLDSRHTVFAQVFEGIETINAINKVEVDAETGRPLTDIKIEKIEIVSYGE